MEKNEKSLFDDLIAADEMEAIPTNEQDETPTSEAIEPDEEAGIEEAGNNPPEEAEQPEAPDETGEEAEEEQVDDRATALWSYMKEEGLVDGEEFSGKPSDLVDILNTLPENLFYRAVENTHPDAQELLSYAFELGENASFEQLKNFFDKYIEQPVQLDDEVAAEAYLKQTLKGNRLFNTEEKINKYVDDLIEKGELVQTAKELEAEKQASKESLRKAEIEKVKAAREQARVETEQYFNTLYEEVQQQPWTDKRKEVVLDALIPQKVAELNQVIQKSPKAVIQLADIYSRFNPKTGEFDLSDFETKAASRKTVEKKDKIAQDKVGSILSGIAPKSKTSKKAEGSFWSHFEKTT